MALRGDIDHQRTRFRLQSAAGKRILGLPLTRCNQRYQRTGGGGVLDYAMPGSTRNNP